MRRRYTDRRPAQEGDQLVTTPGSIPIDATKGNRKVPFSLGQAKTNETCRAHRET